MPPRVVRELASDLARAASDAAGTIGNPVAHVAVYSRFLIRCAVSRQPSPDTALPAQCLSRTEAVLDASADAVLDFYRTAGLEPAIYFHEQFIRALDGAEAKKRGVHYTPPEVVRYMVRSAGRLLRTHLACGLSDCLVLDPCCGIGAFPFEIERSAPGVEVLGLEMDEPTSKLAKIVLANAEVRCVNSLDLLPIDTGGRPLVIIGNPPYSGHSSCRGEVDALLGDYYPEGGERNPKWLRDDYVKFFRMAQARVEDAGSGVVAFITNHSYLTNPTFRRMRRVLAESFDEIEIIDLLGNSRRLDGDENIFGITMGVAIALLTRTPGRRGSRVIYSQLRGSKSRKLAALGRGEAPPGVDIAPVAPFSLFVPTRGDSVEAYLSWPSVVDFFDVKSVGFVTSRDKFAIDTDRNRLLERIGRLRDDRMTPEDIIAAGDLDKEKARQSLLADTEWEHRAVSVIYRPFDMRWAYLAPSVMERPRSAFMDNVIRENVAVAVGRAGHATGAGEWDVVFCADRPADLNLFRRGGAMLLPRWVYNDTQRRSNLIAEALDHDALFFYVYALLHSREYRRRFASLLAVDFPRIPIPKGVSEVASLAEIGRELIHTHLLKIADRGDHPAKGSVTIGGYELPGKYERERGGVGLETVRCAVTRTLTLIDEIDSLADMILAPRS